MGEQTKKWDFDQYSWISEYDNRMRSIKHLKYDEMLFQVFDKAKATEGDLVLDIGVGTGNLAAKFLDEGCQLIGLDPSTKMLEMAEVRLQEWKDHYTMQICEDPFLEIPFTDNTFDVIVSTYSIHHITDGQKRLAVKEMKRVLKPTGVIVIGDVMFKDNADKTRALAEYSDMEDEYQSTLDTFPKMFENVGLAVDIKQVADTIYIVSAKSR
jgi:putative AdoMet-dependent methyltransferase